MLILKSAEQARRERNRIPELAVTRMIQFEGDDGHYDPDCDGFIIVLEEGDDLRLVPVGENGLPEVLDEECPGYEYISFAVEEGRKVYELVVQVDDSKTIAVIIPGGPWLDDTLRSILSSNAEPSPLPVVVL